MKHVSKFLLGLVLLLCASAFGQTILTNTTLSAAVADSKTQTVVVASATGISAPSASDPTKATFLYVDRELMSVIAVNSTTVKVARGVGSTSSAGHISGASVFVIPAYLSSMFKQIPQGSCTRANELALPRIEPASGVISDCLGGQWINGDGSQSTRSTLAINEPPTGGTAYTALETNGTAPSANTEQYCTQLALPYNKMLTGLGLLNGTTAGGTDKHLVALYDGSGYLLANSAVAGAASSGPSTYQAYAFTTPFFAVGPATYWGCIQSNNTGDTIRHVATGTADNRLAGKLTGQTFGTIPAKITPPTTFTTVLGPYFQFY